MHESFLHYVWQLQYFEKTDLRTSTGDKVDILSTGNANTDAGPDFLNAKIKIDDINWAGSVEIHTKASLWNVHHHDSDPAYDNVILHVVWEEDKPVVRSDGSPMPTIILETRVGVDLVNRYKKLVNNVSTIPCDQSLQNVSEIVKISMLDKALLIRLESKARQVLQLLDHVQGDWEEVTYQLLARNFGFKVNRDPLFQLSQALSRKILLKHSDNLVQLESLLFGQAGFLDYTIKDEYMKLLKREYLALQSKYSLKKTQLNKSQWKFLRLRPANFPTLRLAQLAAIFFKHRNLFAKMLDALTLEEARDIFSVSTSDYWHDHYRFGRPTTQSLSGMGEDSINSLIINSVAPILVAYGKKMDDQVLVDRAVHFLQGVGPEKNKIVKSWEQVGWQAKNASDTQALIELHNNFCLKRKCLSCNIGSALIKPQTALS